MKKHPKRRPAKGKPRTAPAGNRSAGRANRALRRQRPAEAERDVTARDRTRRISSKRRGHRAKAKPTGQEAHRLPYTQTDAQDIARRLTPGITVDLAACGGGTARPDRPIRAATREPREVRVLPPSHVLRAAVKAAKRHGLDVTIDASGGLAKGWQHMGHLGCPAELSVSGTDRRLSLRHLIATKCLLTAQNWIKEHLKPEERGNGPNWRLSEGVLRVDCTRRISGDIAEVPAIAIEMIQGAVNLISSRPIMNELTPQPCTLSLIDNRYQ